MHPHSMHALGQHLSKKQPMQVASQQAFHRTKYTACGALHCVSRGLSEVYFSSSMQHSQR